MTPAVRTCALLLALPLMIACEAGGISSGPGAGGGDGPGGGPESPGGDPTDPGGRDPGSAAPTPGADTCGNGVDDDRDGVIDQGCPCAEGDSQACWPGPPSRRNMGACRDGLQRCNPYGEFYAWGPCEGAVLPREEIEANGIDEDCDGGDAGGFDCAPNEFGESCGGGFDDDCDGLVDCADPDCAGAEPCRESCVPGPFGEICDDGDDDDCDGIVDCVDPDCASASACSGDDPEPGCEPELPFILELWCGDGRDNDCDGLIDCDDPDCVRPGECDCEPRESICSDGIDADCDGDVDCADEDCQRCRPGASRWCDDPVYCRWGRQECQPDGRWGTCVEVMDSPPGCTSTLYDRDCCVESGACCQNYPVDDSSVGMCDSIVECS